MQNNRIPWYHEQNHGGSFLLFWHLRNCPIFVKKNNIGIINESIFFLQVLSLSLVWPKKKVFLTFWYCKLNAIYWWMYRRPKWPLWKASLLIADIMGTQQTGHFNEPTVRRHKHGLKTRHRHCWVIETTLPFTRRQQTHIYVHLSSNAESLSCPEDKVVSQPLAVHHSVSRQTGTASVEHRVYVESSTLSKLCQPNMSWTRWSGVLRD